MAERKKERKKDKRKKERKKERKRGLVLGDGCYVCELDPRNLGTYI
jgi:hypothetical protein